MNGLDKKGICKRIKELRMEFFGERSKSIFARELDISPSRYTHYEIDRVPPIEVLIKICDYIEIELYWLLTGFGPKYRHPQKIAQKSTKVAFPEGQNDTERGGKFGKIWKNYKKINENLEKFGKNEHFLSSVSAFIDLLAKKQDLEEKIPKSVDRSEPITRRRSGKQISGIGMSAGKGAEELFVRGGIGGQVERPDWIPVLGRTAAGIVYCWEDSLVPEPKQAVTELDDLVGKYLGKKIVNVTGGQIAVDFHDPELMQYLLRQDVSLIQLAGTGPDEITEFVESEGIFKVFPDSFALRIDGDSMSPRINDNDVVILSPSVPAVQGQISVVRIKNQIGVTCKLIRESGEEMHLIPLNEKFQTKVLKKEELLWALAVLCHIQI